MRVVVVTPPEPIVTFDEAADHLRLGSDQSQKTYVEGLIAAATGHIDGPDGWLGRSLGVQQLEARFSVFPYEVPTALPYGPVLGLVSFNYLDATGEAVTGNVADVQLLGSEIAPAANDFPWAEGSRTREAVRVRYNAGSPDNVLATARAAILLMVGDLFKNRGEALVNLRATTAVLSTTVENLLSPLRLFN